MIRYKMNVHQGQETLNKVQRLVLGLDRNAEFTHEHEAEDFNINNFSLLRGMTKEKIRERRRNVPRYKCFTSLPPFPLHKPTGRL